jgi:hypothetical protein
VVNIAPFFFEVGGPLCCFEDFGRAKGLAIGASPLREVRATNNMVRWLTQRRSK